MLQIGFILSSMIATPIFAYFLFRQNKRTSLAIASCLIAIFSLFISYTKFPVDAETLSQGWPFPSALWILDPQTGEWQDYIGITYYIAPPVNFLFYAAFVLGGMLVYYNFRERNFSKGHHCRAQG
ncbi:MAG: hypothetical protein AAF571_15325 [Verrucomicrobiota bacterium]